MGSYKGYAVVMIDDAGESQIVGNLFFRHEVDAYLVGRMSLGNAWKIVWKGWLPRIRRVWKVVEATWVSSK